jgi:hypothetical protein
MKLNHKYLKKKHPDAKVGALVLLCIGFVLSSVFFFYIVHLIPNLSFCFFLLTFFGIIAFIPFYKDSVPGFDRFSFLFKTLLISFGVLLCIAKIYQIVVWGYVLCILYAFVFFFCICKTPYMQGLTHLKTKTQSFSDVLMLIFPVLKMGIFSVSLAFLGLVITIYIIKIIPMPIVILMYYTFVISVLFTLPVAYVFLVKKINQILLTRKTSLFFWGQSFARLLCFYAKNPLAYKNIFVLWLSCLTLLRSFPPLFLLLVGLSVRFDNGLSIALFMWLGYFTCYFVCLPKTQTYIFQTFGKQSLRLLGWNSPLLFCLQCGGGSLGATILVAGAREGYFYYDDCSREARFDRACKLVEKRNLRVQDIRLMDPTGNHPFTPIPQLDPPRSIFKKINVQAQVNVGLNPSSTINTGAKDAQVSLKGTKKN